MDENSIENFISIDTGENDKLVLFNGTEIMALPESKTLRGLSTAGKTMAVIAWALEQANVVLESPGIGASGIEPLIIRDIVDASPHSIFTISARAVKNLAKDRGIETNTLTDRDCARMIYEIATKPRAELSEWHYQTDKLKRIHTSVRPWDKRGYVGDQVDKWMARLPAFSTLSVEMQDVLTNGKKRNTDYAPARVLPFAMAFDEDGNESRKGYEKIIGLSANGYPSFYRRATVNLMQRIAKLNFRKEFGDNGSGKNGNIVNADITPSMRKEAWRQARRLIRELYSLSK